jgi:hypothetical protein
MALLLRYLRGALSARLFWAAVIALHVPAFLATTRALLDQPGLATLVPWLALAATVSLFILKAFDVPWLRLGSRRRFALVFVIACAFVHHEAAAGAADTASSGAVTAAVVVTAVVAGGLRVLPALRATLRTRGPVGPRLRRFAARQAAFARLLTPISLRLASRGPPLVA